MSSQLPPLLDLVNPIAQRVIVVVDPGQALALCQTLTDAPRMANHQRGLWGYTGVASDGLPLTIQSTGVGPQSAWAVVTQLAEAGLQQLVFTAEAVALVEGASVGGVAVVESVAGTERGSKKLTPDGGLSQLLLSQTESRVAVVSVDTRWAIEPQVALVPDADAWDRECAAVLDCAHGAGVQAAAIASFPSSSEGLEEKKLRWQQAGVAAAAAFELRPVSELS